MLACDLFTVETVALRRTGEVDAPTAELDEEEDVESVAHGRARRRPRAVIGTYFTVEA